MSDCELEMVIFKAVDGDEDAIAAILEQYRPLIVRNSTFDGSLDEDCMQFIMWKVVRAIRKFEI